jgi:hypothetical protein
MKLVKKVLNRINGLHYPQEYLCLARESFQQPLCLYLASENHVVKDISNHHLFTGYSPLVFTLSSDQADSLPHAGIIQIIFSRITLQPNDLIRKKDVLATLFLKKIHNQTADKETFFYYEGIKAGHRFISFFQRHTLQLYNRIYNKKPGNVYLPGNLYKQVQIAYAVPRIISLVTVKLNNLFNLFPTDLHGPAGNNHYIISLRQGGKAAQQVEQSKKILITEISAEFYKIAYTLGKNHMLEPQDRKQFPLTVDLSEILELPLPEYSLCYRELELTDLFDHGIHRFFLFKVLNQKQIENKTLTLAHIHNVYATWRYNNGLPGNYLLR